MNSDRQYIVFDLDGTLVDSFATVVVACRQVLKKHMTGELPTQAFFEALRLAGMEQLFERVASMAGMTAYGFRLAYDQCYARDCTTGTTLIDRQYRLLCQARTQGKAIVVLTNKRQQIAQRVCNDIIGPGMVDIVIGRLDAHPIKPTPLALERLRHCGIDPATQINAYYGDSQDDEQMAAMMNVAYHNI